MFAHIIDSIAERERLNRQQRALPIDGQILPNKDSIDNHSFTIKSCPQSNPLPLTNSQKQNIQIKNQIHGNIEKILHERHDRSLEHHYQPKDWNSQLRKLHFGVSGSQNSPVHDSTFSQLFFSSVITTLKYPFSLYSHSNSCEKGSSTNQP